MKKFYLLLAGIPAFCPAQAQSTAKEEVLLISHQQDSLRGTIDMDRENDLYKPVIFKPHNGTPRVIDMNATKMLWLTNYDICFEPVKLYSPKHKDTLNVFAKTIVNGPSASMFKLDDPGTHFHFETDLSTFYVVRTKDGTYLLQHASTSGHPAYSRYKNDLQILFNDCESIQSSIRGLVYTSASIASVVQQYNRCKGTDGTLKIFKNKVPVTLSHLVEFSGFLGKKYPLNGWYNSQQATGYRIGYALDIAAPLMSKRISTTLGIEFYSISGEVRESGFTFDTTITSLRLPVSGNYYFSTGRLKPFVQAGFALQIVQGDFLSYIHLGAGIGYDRIRFAATWSSLMSLPNFKLYAINATLGYTFLKHRTNQHAANNTKKRAGI